MFKLDLYFQIFLVCYINLIMNVVNGFPYPIKSKL